MLACWQEDPEARPTMANLHSTMKNFEDSEVIQSYDVYRLIRIQILK